MSKTIQAPGVPGNPSNPLDVILSAFAELFRTELAKAIAENVTPANSNADASPVMTRGAVAELLACSASKVDRLVKHDGLPCHGMGEERRFILDEVVEWLRRQPPPAPQKARPKRRDDESEAGPRS